MATAGDPVTLTIDGCPITVPSGTSILHAAAELGIDIPTLCYHPNIAASANCRLCLVEQAADEAADPPPADASLTGESRLLSACRALVEPGQNLFTNSQGVRRSRKGSLKALLSGVDLSEAPDLASLLTEYDIQPNGPPSRADLPVIDDNPYYIRDYAKCVMCWRCVDVCGDEVQLTYAIEPGERGFHVRISTREYDGIMDTTCVYCGNCVQVCPFRRPQEPHPVGTRETGHRRGRRRGRNHLLLLRRRLRAPSPRPRRPDHPRHVARGPPRQPGLALRQGPLRLGLRPER